MKQISRLASGRVTVKNPADVASDRYQFMDLASAEPNLGTAANGSILTTNTVGNRVWTSNLNVSNVTATNDVRADAVYTDHLFYANGQPFITDTVAQDTNIFNGTATATTSITLIDTVDVSGITTVRWSISAKDTVNGRYKSSTIDSVNSGADIYYNEYGVVLSNSAYEVATFTANISSGNVNLYAIGDSASIPITFQRLTLGSDTITGAVPGAGYVQGSTGSGTSTVCEINSYVGNGSQVAYTLTTAPVSENQTIVSVGGLLQPKNTYSVSGTTLTFSSPPPAGAPIEIQHFVTTVVTGYTGSSGSGYTGSAGAVGYTGSAGTFSGSVSGNLTVSGTTFVTGDIIPTSNNTVNIGSATKRFGTLYLAANTIDLGGTTISTTPTGDLAFVTSSGTIDITANTVNFLSTVATTSVQPGATVAPVASIYANIASLPAGSVTTGTLAFVTDVSRLFIYNGSAWINTAPATKNFFYILQTGSFSGSITGNVGYTPTRTITLSSLEASIAQAESANIVFSVQKNGSTLQSFTLLAGQTSLESDFGNNTITTSDTVSMNIVSGSGQDLAVRFIYT